MRQAERARHRKSQATNHSALIRALAVVARKLSAVRHSRRVLGLLAAIAMIPSFAVPITMMAPAAIASPSDHYSGPYFGAGNLPPGCSQNMFSTSCHHMKTGLNALDSPHVDVLIMVPVSPAAERDMRIMRQAVEMWEGGIDYLASEMDLDWLADGMDFHITVDYFDLTGGGGGEFTTYPVVDPEIVVIASNPVGGIGIGVDPVDFVFTNENLVPCHGVSNPFDFGYWENLPGFDSHHDTRSGTYVEDCGGSGGNICFAINGAVDPSQRHIDIFNLFDLVAHEFGHCLTLGHVGDGADGSWGVVPTNDIMAYSLDPPVLNKCVSTLDVEAVAIRMSQYLDVNGDNTVDSQDRLLANDQIGDGRRAFQVQHPDDHLYASSTGSPMDCPQPDLGLIPGSRTDWTPTPVSTVEPQLTIMSPEEGAVSDTGSFDVTGTVGYVSLQAPGPTEPLGFYDDADGDASTPFTEILDVSVEVTATHVRTTMRLADIWRSTSALSPTSYNVVIDGRRFSSFVRYPHDQNPRTWDTGAGAYMPAGTSSWDLQAKTVTFNISRNYLANANITSPYFVGTTANIGLLSTGLIDDRAPEGATSIGVASSRIFRPRVPQSPLLDRVTTVTFEHEGGNTFFPEDSTVGETQLVGHDPSHYFTLDVSPTSDVEFTLTWTDSVGTTDLDLYVTGAGDSGTQGATLSNPEHFILQDVTGTVDIKVSPYLVTEPFGTNYTLTAIVHTDSDGDGLNDSDDACPNEGGPLPHGCPDADGDGVPDTDDACPDVPGDGADGCPTEFVKVYVGGLLVGSDAVYPNDGPDTFVITIQLPAGTHELLIQWEDDGLVIAAAQVTVTSNAT